MSILLPPFDEERQLREEVNAEAMAQAEEQTEEAKHWTKVLQQIDHSLELYWVGDRADPSGELTPARWHIRKKIEDGPDYWLELSGPDGQMMPPGGWILDLLARMDMWNQGNVKRRERAKERLQRQINKRNALEKEQRLDEARLAVRAARRIRSDAGMTQRTDLKKPPEPKPDKGIILP